MPISAAVYLDVDLVACTETDDSLPESMSSSISSTASCFVPIHSAKATVVCGSPVSVAPDCRPDSDDSASSEENLGQSDSSSGRSPAMATFIESNLEKVKVSQYVLCRK